MSRLSAWVAPGFFFQAEDGIRDYKVTGVQTCALPISALLMALLLAGNGNSSSTSVRNIASNSAMSSAAGLALPATSPSATRSEERRGGREGGPRPSRGWGDGDIVRMAHDETSVGQRSE